MFCGKCGAELPDNAVICGYCGEPVGTQPTAGNQGAYTAPADYQQPTYQQPAYQQPTYQQPTMGYTDPGQPPVNYFAQPQQYPMKWYKFLIYFSLFAGAVMNVISGIMVLSGSQYDGKADLVYSFYDGLKTTDTLFGIACIVTAVLFVYARFQLAGYKRNAPTALMIAYAVPLVATLIYLIAVSSILSEAGVSTGDLISEQIGSMVGSAIVLVANYVYFNKRKSLFVN